MPPEKSSPSPRPPLDRAEIREWLDSLDDVLRRHGPGEAGRLLGLLQAHGNRKGLSGAGSGSRRPTSTRSRVRGGALSRRLAARAADQEPGPLERHGHGRPRQPRERGPRRTHLHLRLVRHAVRGRLQPFPAGPGRERPRRHVFFQGHASPGVYARAFLEGRLSEEQLENFRRELPAAPGPVVLSAPLAHAGLLGVPDGVDGPRPDHGHLPGALQSLPARPRPQGHRRQSRLVLHRRRRVRRAGDAGLDLARGPRAARQPDLRRQLQPAAPRRPRSRQRQDHPGAGGRLPRRRLERASRSSGAATGTRCSRRTTGPSRRAHERGRGRRVPEVQRRGRLLHPRALLRQAPPSCASWWSTSPTSSSAGWTAAGTIRGRSTPPTRRRWSTGARPPSSSPRRSRATASGEAGEGRNVTHQQKKLNEEELREFRSRFGIPDPGRSDPAKRPSIGPPDDSPEMVYLRERRQRARRLRAETPRHGRASAGAGPRLLRRVPGGERRAAGGHHHGLRPPAAQAATRPRGSVARVVPIIPDEARTFGMDALFRRYGIYSHVGPALRAGRPGHRSCPTARPRTARFSRRASPRPARCPRSSRPERRTLTHGVEMVPFFIVLFDVRLPAHRRPHLGRGRLTRKGLPAGRHRRPHDPGRRRAAAPGRPQPPPGRHRAQRAGLRSGLRLRDRGHRSGRAQAHVRAAGGAHLLPHAVQRDVPDARHAGGRSRRHPQGDVPARTAGAGQTRTGGSSSSAADRSCARRSAPGRSSPSDTTSRPTSGASPATRSCGATPSPSSAGTCCHPGAAAAAQLRRRAAGRRSRAPSSPSAIT